MSDEVFELLEKQKKENGITYWACRPCTTFAQGMNHRLKQIGEELEEVKKNTTTNTEAIKQLEKKVEEVVVLAKKTDGISKEEMEARLKEEREEVRDRKDREANVIVHGLDECEEQGLSGNERMELDTQSSIELFAEAGTRVARHEIKFCRRVGPPGR
jgi:seryl-tRNA synthetase